MSTRDAPSTSTSGTPGQALATKQTWSASRNQFVMDGYSYPGVVMQDTFQNATGTWLGVPASGGTGSINPSSTVCANNPVSGKSLQVTANASSRYYAVRKLDITPHQKMGFNVFFCYDNPSNVSYINFEMQWRDVDHGYTHFAGLRYGTANSPSPNTWQYLPNTSTSPSGAWANLPGTTTTMSSGAGSWHEMYYDANFGSGFFDEFLSGQIGLTNNALSTYAIPLFVETTEAQRLEVRLGLETSASGAGNAWFSDVTIFEVD